MSINSYIRKRIVIFLVSAVLLVALMFGSSYALLTNELAGSNDTITLTVDNNPLRVIYYDTWVLKEDAINNVVEISNDNVLKTNIELYLQVLSKNKIDLNTIYYSINGSEPKKYSSDVIYQKELDGYHTAKISLRIWVPDEYYQTGVNFKLDVKDSKRK